MWKVDFIEKLKNMLFSEEWQTVSIYKAKDKVLVYVNGELKLEMPVETEEGVENDDNVCNH